VGRVSCASMFATMPASVFASSKQSCNRISERIAFKNYAQSDVVDRTLDVRKSQASCEVKTLLVQLQTLQPSCRLIRMTKICEVGQMEMRVRASANAKPRLQPCLKRSKCAHEAG